MESEVSFSFKAGESTLPPHQDFAKIKVNKYKKKKKRVCDGKVQKPMDWRVQQISEEVKGED